MTRRPPRESYRRDNMKQQDNFVYLLVGLLITLIAAPIAEQQHGHVGAVLNELALSGTLAVGLWSLRAERRRFLLAGGLAAVGIILTVTAIFVPVQVLKVTSILVILSFLGISTIITARQVLFVAPVDGNKIVGAVCIYLLLGLIWAIIFYLLHALTPGSFNGVNAAPLSAQLSEFVCFSFVTLTTLGYGDVSPAQPAARTLAYMEAVFGQFYIAILVASLVGVYVSGRMEVTQKGGVDT